MPVNTSSEKKTDATRGRGSYVDQRLQGHMHLINDSDVNTIKCTSLVEWPSLNKDASCWQIL